MTCSQLKKNLLLLCAHGSDDVMKKLKELEIPHTSLVEQVDRTRYVYSPHICALIKGYSRKYIPRVFIMVWKTFKDARRTQKWSSLLDLRPHSSSDLHPPKPTTQLMAGTRKSFGLTKKTVPSLLLVL